LALLAHTDTLGLLIPQMISAPYTPHRLVQIRVSEPIPGPLTGIVTRSDAPLTPAAAAMAQAIGAIARGLARTS
jgi:hypothetical protein